MKDTLVPIESNPTSKTRKGPEDRIEIKRDSILKSKKRDDSDYDDVFSVHIQKKKKKKVVIQEPESSSDEEESITLSPARKVQELPYVDVPPLSYKGKERATNIEIPKAEKKQPQYKVSAPLADPDQADAIIRKLLDTPMNITAGEAMGVSRQLRDLLKKLLSNKRTQVEEREKVSTLWHATNELPPPRIMTQVGGEFIEEEMIHVDRLPAATFMITEVATATIPKGSIIIGDPVLQYLESLEPGEKPKTIYVSGESESSRVIYPIVNNKQEEEGLLDTGSEILSMHKDVQARLGISYNPDIVIHMQSANEAVESTLGLARNVPFTFGDMTVFLQLHIVKNAPYKILLGRPFDCLTKSIVTNSTDGDQTLTITDPNTGKRQVVPTFPRGHKRKAKSTEKQADAASFYNSMS